jgi:hypothetical protein
MFKFIAAIFCLISCAQTFADVVITPYGNQLIYTVTVDGLIPVRKTIAKQQFVDIGLKGISPQYRGIVYRPGQPALPVVRFYVEGDIDINLSENPETFGLPTGFQNLPVVPNQLPLVKLPSARETFSFDQKFYSTDAFFPAAPFYVENAGMYRGRQRKLVTIFPLAYNPAQTRFKFRPRFVIRTSRPHAEPPSQPVIALVIGAKFAQSPSLQAYAQFRQKQGFKVVAVQMGRDANSPDEIRAKLQQIYQGSKSGLQFALLVGDIEDVPARKGLFIGGPTDHYYRAIDTADYSKDINGPDISVGRFPAANEEQLQAMVAKTLRYQTLQPRQTPWLNRATWLATSDRYQVAEGTHNYAISTYTAASGYVGVFPSNPMAGGDQLYPITHRASRAQVTQVIQGGSGWLQYSGHGSTSGWEMLGPSDVKGITTDSLPFVISNSCNTGSFATPESFAETWLRHPKGAIFFWGSVDLTYWDEDDILERRQIDGMYKDRRTFGEITNFALSEFWRHYGGQGMSSYYWETYTSFGDPSVQFLLFKK